MPQAARPQRYLLYGLVIESPWVLPCVRYSGDHPTDLTLRDGRETVRGMDSDGPPLEGRAFAFKELDDGALSVSWPNLFDFLIESDGSTVWGRPNRRTSLDAFEAYLLSQVMSFALLLRGVDALHATVVEVEGRGVAMIGPSGVGKSSLAAGFMRAGGRLITDDLLVTKRERDGLIAFLGPRRIKLFPEVARSFLSADCQGEPMNPLTRKQIFPIADESRPLAQSVPLAAVFVLRRPSGSERITVRALGGLSSFRALAQNTFNTVYQTGPRLAEHVRSTTEVARTVPIYSATYPRSLQRVPEVISTLLRRTAG